MINSASVCRLHPLPHRLKLKERGRIMLKKLAVLIVVLSALSMSAQAFWKSDITMLVVPREALPVQIAQDISRRYPVLLVCYQQDDRGRHSQIRCSQGSAWARSTSLGATHSSSVPGRCPTRRTRSHRPGRRGSTLPCRGCAREGGRGTACA